MPGGMGPLKISALKPETPCVKPPPTGLPKTPGRPETSFGACSPQLSPHTVLFRARIAGVDPVVDLHTRTHPEEDSPVVVRGPGKLLLQPPREGGDFGRHLLTQGPPGPTSTHTRLPTFKRSLGLGEGPGPHEERVHWEITGRLGDHPDLWGGGQMAGWIPDHEKKMRVNGLEITLRWDWVFWS